MRSIIADTKVILKETSKATYLDSADKRREALKQMRLAQRRREFVAKRLEQEKQMMLQNSKDLNQIRETLEKRREYILDQMKLPKEFFDDNKLVRKHDASSSATKLWAPINPSNAAETYQNMLRQR